MKTYTVHDLKSTKLLCVTEAPAGEYVPAALARELVEVLEEAVSGLHAHCEGATEHTIARAEAILREAKGETT